MMHQLKIENAKAAVSGKPDITYINLDTRVYGASRESRVNRLVNQKCYCFQESRG
jgi:hypothetical protein